MIKFFASLLFRSPLFIPLLIPFNAAASSCNKNNTYKTIPDIQLVMIADDINSPVAITHAKDGSSRVFVLEQQGVIRVIDNQQLQTQAFLDIRHKVKSRGEKGLLGLAFHPRYKQNGRFFLNYTADRNGLTTVIAEYRIDKHGIVNTANEISLFEVKQPWGNHNGGHLAFGPDGYLYIGMGDGGSANDPHNNGQDLSTLLGSILRIDVDTPSNKLPYTIPADNPFVNNKKARPEIWAYGLRNPWRFSFDRATGQLYAADVGQDDVEEINIIEKGKNYGWRIMEGSICTPGVAKKCNTKGLSLPIYSYGHDIGRAITGGYVYRGSQFPALCGTYLYGDFVNQAIWGIRYHQGKITTHKTLFESRPMLRLIIDYFADDGLLISTFGEDEAGELYVAAYQSGRIYHIAKK